MPDLSETAWPVLAGFAVAFAASVLIALTKRWHGALTSDVPAGPQKFHDTFTPRVGGLAVLMGFWTAAAVTPQPLRTLLFALGLSGIPAFAAGLAEDLTKRISSRLRLFATMLSGVLFCVATGYSVTRLEIHLIDDFMGIPLVSLAFTAFAISGLANAVNIIDGFHGLAAGSVIIMSSAFAIVAHAVGDHELVMLVAVAVAVLSGFLLMNFPRGYVFLGDGGAYFSGFVLGAVGVMLPMRNPEVSVWVSLVILAYPVLETMYAILRKTIRDGHRPTRPDGAHLHMLIYRRIARTAKNRRSANPATSVLLWGGAATSLIFVVSSPYDREWSLLALSLQIVLYALAYRKVATPHRHPVPRAARTPSRRA